MLSSIFKNSLLYSGSAIVLKGMAIFLIPFYLRVFSPEEFGSIDLAISLSAFVGTLISCGLSQMYFVNYHHLDSRNKIYLLVNTTKAYYFISFVGVFSFSLVLEYVSYLSGFSPEMKVFITIISFLTFFEMLYFNVLQVQERVKEVSVIRVSLGLIMLMLNVVLVFYIEFGVLSILLSNAITLTISFFLYHRFLINQCKMYNIKSFSTDGFIEIFRKHIGEAVTLLGGQISYFVQTQIDRWVVLAMIGIANVGLYAVATKIGSLMSIVIIAPFLAAYVPPLLRRYVGEDVIDVDNKNKRVSYMIIIFGALVSLFTYYCLNPPFIFMVGVEYEEAFLPMVILLMGQFLSWSQQVRNCLLVHLKKLKLQLIGTWLSVVINLILNIILTKQYQLTGTAIATLSGYLFWVVYTDIVSRKALNRFYYERN